MIPSSVWKGENLIRELRGTTLHEQSWTATGVSTDALNAMAGDLFVAVNKGHKDGHEDVARACVAGAKAALVSRRPMNVPPDFPLVFVDDTALALGALAKWAHARSRAKVVAVAGTVGKTCVKEMLGRCLRAVGKTFEYERACNDANDAALALANLPPECDFGVFEIGSDALETPKEVSQTLCPDVVVYSALEPARLGLYGSCDNLVDVLSGAVSGMAEGGSVVIDKDGGLASGMMAALKKKGFKKVLFSSAHEKADFMLREFAMKQDGSLVKISAKGKDVFYQIGAPGPHHIRNSITALLASFAASGLVEECAAALSPFAPSNGRGLVQHIPLFDGGSFSMIDERGNACPAAVRAAIAVLGGVTPWGLGRRVLVLGDMSDMGAAAADCHMGLAVDIKAASIASVFCVGEKVRYLYDVLPEDVRGAYAEDGEELAFLLSRNIGYDDVVMVKGALGDDMDYVVSALDGLNALVQLKTANA